MANEKKVTSKVGKVTSEVKASEELKVQQVPEVLISFETYIAKAKPGNGLVASFKYEAERSEKGLKERSEAEWAEDFQAQATREYSSF